MKLSHTIVEVGAFVLRIYSDIQDAFISLMVYSAAIAFSVGVLYSMMVRWTWIADKYYGKRVFDRGFGNYASITAVVLILIALIIAGVWVASTIWVVYLALVVVLWLASLVFLGIHRRMSPGMPERPIVMSMMERKRGYAPLATSHQQLDHMLVLLIVILSFTFLKLIFLTVCFVLAPLFFITPLYYIFGVGPDLAFVTLLSNTEALPLFEHERHMPSVREEIRQQELSGALPYAHNNLGANASPIYTVPPQPTAQTHGLDPASQQVHQMPSEVRRQGYVEQLPYGQIEPVSSQPYLTREMPQSGGVSEPEEFMVVPR